MKRNLVFSCLGIFIILGSCFAGIFGGYVGTRLRPGDSFPDLNGIISQGVRVTNEESAIIDVASTASPSVVSIVISKDVPIYENYYYDPYTDGFSNRLPTRRQTGTEEKQIGAGSGFVISADGMIITNRHVVDQDDVSYTVIFNDGTKKVAKVLARDTVLDIAFLKVEATGLTPLTLGSSENLKVGQTVVAIGNALGEFSNTVSSGIISGLKRNIIAGDSTGTLSEELNNVIQTDASINPGNSGGPLLDINGNVVGVNVAVAEAENIGFAIPIDIVKDLLTRLSTEGKIERPVLGVRYILVDDAVKKENSLTVDYGALVARGTSQIAVAVLPGSPADKAGIIENDIILEIDSTKINSKNPLQQQIQEKRIGDIITLKVLRKGVEQDIKVTLDRFEQE